MDMHRGARLGQPLTEISAAEKELKMLQRCIREGGFARSRRASRQDRK